MKCPCHGRWVGEFQTSDPCWAKTWKNSKPQTAPLTSGDEGVRSEPGPVLAPGPAPTAADESLFGSVHDQAVALMKRAFKAQVVHEGARR